MKTQVINTWFHAVLFIGTMMWLIPSQTLASGNETNETCEAIVFDPLDLYGDEIFFDVLRDGDVVGFHRVTFDRSDQGLRVNVDFELDVRILFFNAYSYRYSSVSLWQNGCLQTLSSWVDDNGDKSSVNARFLDDGILIEGPGGKRHTLSGLFPTNHWHPGVIDQSLVLNTISGDLDSVTIADQGLEIVQTAGGEMEARRFSYTGDLENDVWYDASGRWVKMRFAAQDGSIIEYRCRSCNNVSAASL